MSADPVFGGLVITRPVVRDSYMDESLLPAETISLSGCIAPLLPPPWFPDHPDDHWVEMAARFGVEPARFSEIQDYMERGVQDGRHVRPSTFTSLDAVGAFLRHFDVRMQDVLVVARALARWDLARHVDEWKHVEAASPFLALLASDLPMPAGGAVLGWEPLACEGVEWFHSWLCNGIETTAHAELGVRPNAAGFIEHADDARRVVELCEVPGNAEPLTWSAWQLTRWEARDVR